MGKVIGRRGRVAQAIRSRGAGRGRPRGRRRHRRHRRLSPNQLSSNQPKVPLLEVGRIVKPHGLRGEVVVELVTNREERVAPGTVLRGGERELEVVRARPFSATGAGRWIVTFRGVEDLSAAEALRDAVLSAPPLDDPDAFWVHELIGADGRRGDRRAAGHRRGGAGQPGQRPARPVERRADPPALRHRSGRGDRSRSICPPACSTSEAGAHRRLHHLPGPGRGCGSRPA